MDTIDYVALSKSRYTDQFDYDPTFNAIVQTLIEYKMRVQGLYINFANTILDIEKSTGKNLDLIGSIVGQERILVDYYAKPFFGFDGNPKAEPFDKGLWYSLFSDSGGDSRVLTDEEYRRVIKARIIRNKTNCTRKDFADIMYLLLGFNSQLPRNYITDSNIEKSVDLSKGAVELLYQSSRLLNEAYSSGTVTISFDIKIEGVDPEGGEVVVGSTYGKPDWVFTQSISNVKDVYERRSVTVTPTRQVANSSGTSSLTFLHSKSTEGRKIYIKNVQVELGTKASDWTQAKEDLFKLDSKSHGNIDLSFPKGFSSDFVSYFLSKMDDLDSLIPRPLGYKLNVYIRS